MDSSQYQDRPMWDEWQAWRKLCETLKIHGIDINEADDLCAVIKDWGVSYATLCEAKPELVKPTNR